MAADQITKQCSKCKQIKPVSEFRVRRRRRGNNKAKTHRVDVTEFAKPSLESWCKSCLYIAEKERNASPETAARKHALRIIRDNAEEAVHKRREQDRKRYQNPDRRASMYAAQLRYYKNNPQKRRAWRAVHLAIKNGTIPPASHKKCGCGNTADHYHHHNGYDDMHLLDVVPVCRECHEEEHHSSTSAFSGLSGLQ